MSDDEKLSGFVDRELDPKEQADMAAALERDQGAREKLARMQRTDALVRAAHDGPMREAVPDRFLRAIDAGLASSDVTRLPAPIARAANDNRKTWWLTGSAVAASLMLGVLIGPQILPQGGGGSAALSVALSDALETSPSAKSVTLQSGEAITPQLTFARTGGGHCRQFTLASRSTTQAGLACRDDGRWSLEALLPSSAAGSAEAGYVAAEGPSDAALTATIDALRAGDPLDKAAEDALIARRWR